jgi:hypothetical protein
MRRKMRTSANFAIGIGSSFLPRILLHQPAHCFLAFARVGHRLRTGRDRESRDFHHLRRIVIDRQRDAIVSRDIRRLLTVEPAKKI